MIQAALRRLAALAAAAVLALPAAAGTLLIPVDNTREVTGRDAWSPDAQAVRTVWLTPNFPQATLSRTMKKDRMDGKRNMKRRPGRMLHREPSASAHIPPTHQRLHPAANLTQAVPRRTVEAGTLQTAAERGMRGPDTWEAVIMPTQSAARRLTAAGNAAYRVKGIGKRERTVIRHNRWVDGLRGDRRSIFHTLGSPLSRVYEDNSGREREVWAYPELHREFVFEDNRLVQTRII